VLHAFAGAKKRGVDVKIVVDEKQNANNEPREANIAAISQEGIQELVIPRESNASYISHNKFIVLRHKDQSKAVWTGSTNISQGGIFGQSNVGHVVEDPTIAEHYLDYWNLLAEDQDAKELRPWNEASTQLPADPSQLKQGTSLVFSPRESLDALNFYADCMRSAKQGVFLTAAFGINTALKNVLKEKKEFLRYVLLESIYVQKGRQRIKDKDIVILMKRDPNDRFAVGAYLTKDVLGKWVAEQLSGLNKWVKYFHTKFMLVDPLGSDPLVITGSANFSDASTTKNDENMLLIRGEPRVADIYLTEFMRLFQHYEFRSRVMRVSANLAVENVDEENTVEKGPGAPLDETDDWWKRFFVDDSPRAKERIMFS